MTNNVVIKKLTSERFAEWDSYVNQHEEGTFFHLSGWKSVIERAYGHNTYYFFAEEEGRIVGLIPLTQIKSRLFGNALISNPFCVYGGAIAENSDIRSMLETVAEEASITLKVDYLELRNMAQTNSEWPVKELYVTFRKELAPEPEANLNAIPRRQRRMVRQGIKAGLKSVVLNDIQQFFSIYSYSVRNHGTPVFPKKYFTILKEIFGDKCEIRVVYHGENAVSTVMSFYFRDEVLPYYAGGTLDARKYSAFDFMYWDLMQDACLRGIRIFDYGRSKIGTGPYNFKKNWGFSPQPLMYQYKLVAAKSVPEVNPLNPKYQHFIKMWRRLPVPIANVIGPWLARSLG